MATLVLSAVGTALGGPLGGAVGALVGGRIDGKLFGSKREGPRLKELSATTSTYGQPIPAHTGQVRTAGSVIWATDLQESSQSSGGKGQPKTTSYSYSISFAVLLSSRPIDDVGRIWADGNLLRGAAGDLKTGGTMRLYRGHGDQPADPLMSAVLNERCPAFRGCAYVVFEDLQLAEFGNRLPALTFEILAGQRADVIDLLTTPLQAATGSQPLLPQIDGYSHEGASIADNLALLDTLEPLVLDLRAETPTLKRPAGVALPLPSDAAVWDDGDYGTRDGIRLDRKGGSTASINGIRYYDRERDYLPGVQRRAARSAGEGSRMFELPATLTPGSARKVVERLAQRGEASRERVFYRVPELDPDISAGTLVRLARRPGVWIVEAWEWREQGIEYELARFRQDTGETVDPSASAGDPWHPRDRLPGTSLLEVFELPPDGRSGSFVGSTYAALAAQGGRWAGATVYANRDGVLSPIADAGQRTAVMGETVSVLGSSRSLLFEPRATLEVRLFDEEADLPNGTMLELANGANRALVGDEILQYRRAVPVGGGRWRLEGLLRGRGATEAAARSGHAVATRFVLLDDRILDIGDGLLAGDTQVAALGRADEEPVSAPVTSRSAATRPPMPVHAKARLRHDGSLELGWVRRARGFWTWQDGISVPLVEEFERYEVGVGNPSSPLVLQSTNAPTITLSSELLSDIAGGDPHPVWVRQVGSYALSDPLLLTILS